MPFAISAVKRGLDSFQKLGKISRSKWLFEDIVGIVRGKKAGSDLLGPEYRPTVHHMLSSR